MWWRRGEGGVEVCCGGEVEWVGVDEMEALCNTMWSWWLWLKLEVRAHSVSARSMMVSRTRAPQRDLSTEVATRFFEDNVTASRLLDPKAIWKYEREWKQSGDWASLFGYRQALSDIFEATGGFLLRQKKFAVQLKSFVEAYGGRADTVELSTFRLRMMMTHCRAFKKANREPPERFAALGAVLNKIDCRDSVGSESFLEGDDDGSACEEIDLDDDMHANVFDQVPDEVPDSVIDEMHITNDYIDALDLVLFNPARNMQPIYVADDPVAEPPCKSRRFRQKTSESKAQRDNHVDANEMAKLANTDTSDAPTPRDYRAMFGKAPQAKAKKTMMSEGKAKKAMKAKATSKKTGAAAHPDPLNHETIDCMFLFIRVSM